MSAQETTTPAAYTVSASPHVHSGASVPRIMLDVILAMVPAMAASIWFFGLDAVRLLLICTATCVAIEFACRRAMKRDIGITDFSAAVTGILLALNLPPALPAWQAVIGCVFAVAIAKQVFGGLGYNPFNPALIGRVALLIAFPVSMTTWSQWAIPSPAAGIDAVTGATPLGLLKTSLSSTGTIPFAFDARTAWEFFLGDKNGCIGEGSGLALILGGLYLLWRRCITWHTPLAYIGTVAVFSQILVMVDPQHNLGPLFHILSGGLLIGAIFMATDMVTTPVTVSGQLIFGAGCGILTMVIRRWGGYPEGVSFAILIMNALTPLINRATRPRVFGRKRRPPAHPKETKA